MIKITNSQPTKTKRETKAERSAPQLKSLSGARGPDAGARAAASTAIVDAPKPLAIVVGAGIAGLSVANQLASTYRVKVYEANGSVGGQTESFVFEGRAYPLGATGAVRGPYDNILRHIKKEDLYRIHGGRRYDLNGAMILRSNFTKIRIAHQALRYIFTRFSENKLNRPWSEVVKAHGLEDLATRIGTMLEASGYTPRELPVRYVREYVSRKMILALITKPILGFKNGTHQVCESLANEAKDKGVEIHLGSPVQEVKVDNSNPAGALVTVREIGQWADKVILTGDATRSLDILSENNPLREAAFKEMQHEVYHVTVCRMDGMPDRNKGGPLSTIPSNMTKERRGHPMMWLKKEKDTNVYVVWSFAGGGITDATITQNINAAFKLISKTENEIEVLHQKTWDNYFPHFNTEQLNAGALEKVEAAQKGPVTVAGMGSGKTLSTMFLSARAATKDAKRI